jgi:HTH-type transcriptional regulator / antitoxin HigA
MSNQHAPAIPPGTYVQEELDERGWAQLDLADILGRPVRLVNEIISGKRAITPETAQGLAAAFGTSAQLWMNLESAYRLRLAENDSSEGVSTRAELFTKAPVRDMQRRGWIRPTNSTEDLKTELLTFFGIASIDAPVPLSVNMRRTDTSEGLTSSQVAWCVRARQLAAAQMVAAFIPENWPTLMSQVRQLMAYSRDARKLPSVFARFGVRFVVVEPLPGSKIDGAAFWLDERSPAIAVSIRYDRIDAFWFTVLHECSHLHHMDVFAIDSELVGAPGKTVNEIEARANLEAAAALVPPTEMESFVRRIAPLYSKQRINQFANVIRIHPGIIVGQLQHRGEVGYNSHREMLVKVRDIVIDTTLTDGWGKTIAPDVL